ANLIRLVFLKLRKYSLVLHRSLEEFRGSTGNTFCVVRTAPQAAAIFAVPASMPSSSIRRNGAAACANTSDQNRASNISMLPSLSITQLERDTIYGLPARSLRNRDRAGRPIFKGGGDYR